MTQNFKIRACFIQNFIELDMENFLDFQAVTCGVWGPKTSLRQFGPEAVGRDLSLYKSRILAPILKTRPHFLQNHKMILIKL